MANKQFNVETTFTSIDKTSDVISKIQKSFDMLNSKVLEVNKNFNQSFHLITGNLSNFNSSFIKSDTVIGKATKSFNDLNQTTTNYIKNQKDSIKSINEKSGALDNLNPRINRYFEGIGGIGVKLNEFTLKMTLAITGIKEFSKFLLESVNLAGKVEKALIKVSNVTGKTGEDLQQMKNIAIEVGESTKFTTADMLEAQKNLGQMGLITAETSSKSIEKLTKTVAFYAVASDRTIQQASADLGNLSKAFGGDIDEMADKFLYLANTSSISLDEMRNFSKYGTIAQVFNQDIDSLLALTEAYRNVAPSTRIATTHIQSFVNSLNSVHKNANKLAEEQTIAKAIGKQDIIYDANGNLRNMVDIIADLESAYTELGYTQQEITTSLGKIFNATASNVYFGVLATGIDTVRERTEKIGTDSVGIVEKSAEAMGNTYDGLVERIKGKLENLQVEIGEALLPMASDILTTFMDILNAVDLTSFINTIKTVITPLFDIVKEMSIFISSNIMPIINRVLETVNKIIGSLWSFIQPFVDVLMGLANTLIKPINDDLINPILETIDVLVDTLQPVIETIGNTLKSLSPILGLIGEVIIKRISVPLKIITTIIQSILEFLKPIFEISEKGSVVFGEILNILTNIADVILKKIFDFVNWITDGMTNIIKLISGPFINAANFISEKFGEVFGFVSDIVKGIKEFFGITETEINNLSDNVDNSFSKTVLDLKSKLTDLSTKLKSDINAISMYMNDDLEEYTEDTMKIFENMMSNFKKLKNETTKSINETTENMAKITADFYNEEAKKITDLSNTEKEIVDRKTELYQKWQDTIKKATEKVYNEEKKLNEYREDWENKKLQKIQDYNDKILEAETDIRNKLMKPHSITKSEFQSMFGEALSPEYFSEQLTDSFLSIDDKITKGLDFISKVYPNEIGMIYSNLQKEVEKEQNKLFKQYLTDEELFIFGDVEGRKRAIQQKYPEMANQLLKELDDVEKEIKGKEITDLIKGVTVVDDTGLNKLYEERSKIADLTIEEDDNYKKLKDSVKDYNKELKEIKSDKFLETLESQDDTLTKLKNKYKDLTTELSYLNIQFNDINSNFDSDSITEYMKSLDKFVNTKIQDTELSNNEEQLDSFMKIFSNETAKESANNFEKFSKSLTDFNENLVTLVADKQDLELIIDMMERLKSTGKTGGIIDITGIAYNTKLLDEDGNVQIENVSAFIEKVRSEGIEIEAGINKQSLIKISSDIEDAMVLGQIRALGMDLTDFQKWITETKSKSLSLRDYLNYLISRTSENYEGGLIGDKSNLIFNNSKSKDNTLITAHTDEFILKSKTTKKLMSTIGKEGLNRLNETGDISNIIDYNDFFKERLKKEIQKKSNENNNTNNINNSNTNNTNNNYSYNTTIKIEETSKKVDDVNLKRALTRILRKIG